jgi:hypothetical protein
MDPSIRRFEYDKRNASKLPRVPSIRFDIEGSTLMGDPGPAASSCNTVELDDDALSKSLKLIRWSLMHSVVTPISLPSSTIVVGDENVDMVPSSSGHTSATDTFDLLLRPKLLTLRRRTFITEYPGKIEGQTRVNTIRICYHNN